MSRMEETQALSLMISNLVDTRFERTRIYHYLKIIIDHLIIFEINVSILLGDSFNFMN